MRCTVGALVLGILASVLAPVRAEALTPVSVIVFPGGFNWPIWAAQEQGFFKQEGIEVTVTPTPSSVYQLTNLISGKFDIAMTAFDNVVAYDIGQGEAKVAGNPDLIAFMGGDDGFLSLVVPDSITSYNDLRGKRLAVDALTTGYAFVLEQMLADHGLKKGDYTLVSAGGVLQRWQAMLKGEYSGTLLVTPFDILARAKGLHPLGYAINDLHSYQGVVGATRRSWARSHSSELISYVRAYKRALIWLYDRANRAAALKILETHVPTMTPGLASRTYDVLLGETGGFTRDARLNAAGIQTVIGLRKAYAGGDPALGNPNAFEDQTYYKRAGGR